MPYPWASFSSFYFQHEEWPIFGTDSRWALKPSVDRARPLGSSIDSIATLAIGSAERSFECYLSPSRFTTLEALVNTTAEFCDWDRPKPNSRRAFLQELTPVEVLDVACPDGLTRQRVRSRVLLVSQS